MGPFTKLPLVMEQIQKYVNRTRTQISNSNLELESRTQTQILDPVKIYIGLNIYLVATQISLEWNKNTHFSMLLIMNPLTFSEDFSCLSSGWIYSRLYMWNPLKKSFDSQCFLGAKYCKNLSSSKFFISYYLITTVINGISDQNTIIKIFYLHKSAPNYTETGS